MPTPVIDLVEHLRNHVLRDVPSPQLFEDDLLVMGLNDAHKRFARTTHCYVDTLETLNTVAGTRLYALPENTIFLREILCDGRYLAPYTRRAKAPVGFSGRPLAYSTDTSQRNIRVYPQPDDVYTLELERAVTPETLDIDAVIPLDDEWAYLLCLWAAYRALRNNDPDGSQTIAAKDFYGEWGLHLRQAKIEFTRRAMGDNPQAQPRNWT